MYIILHWNTHTRVCPFTLLYAAMYIILQYSYPYSCISPYNEILIHTDIHHLTTEICICTNVHYLTLKCACTSSDIEIHICTVVHHLTMKYAYVLMYIIWHWNMHMYSRTSSDNEIRVHTLVHHLTIKYVYVLMYIIWQWKTHMYSLSNWPLQTGQHCPWISIRSDFGHSNLGQVCSVSWRSQTIRPSLKRDERKCQWF